MGMLGVRLGFLLWLRSQDQPPPDGGHRAPSPKEGHRPSSATSEKALRAAGDGLNRPFGLAL